MKSTRTSTETRLAKTAARKAEADREATIAAIASQRLSVHTLEVRGRDHLDFHDIGVAGLRKALAEAYEAGRAAAR